jgi:nucleoside-triphosphatase THEP1
LKRQVHYICYKHTCYIHTEDELTEGIKEASDVFIIDEAGPLEVKRNAGLEPALSEVMKQSSRGRASV